MTSYEKSFPVSLMIRCHAHIVIVDFRALAVGQYAGGVAVERRAAFGVGYGILQLNSPGVRFRLTTLPDLAAGYEPVALHFGSQLHSVPSPGLPIEGDGLVHAAGGFLAT